MDVGVRELKQHLSEYLERAAKGETIRVTDRGQAKAILGPLPGTERLAAGIAEGWIRPALTQDAAGTVVRVRSERSSSDVLNEDRDE
jgi:prevent-host-death family protein